MNLNEFAFASNARARSKAVRIVHLQNGVTTNERKKKTSNAPTSSKSSNTDHLHYMDNRSNSMTVTSNATVTTVEETGILIAIAEGRGEASCEVGLSVINTQDPELSLFQISDTSSYLKVLNKVHFLNPFEILVPITMSTSRLVEFLKKVFPTVKITAIDRSVFRKDSGLQFVKDVCAKAYNPVLLFLQHKYYTLTATGALRTYLEMYKRQFYAKESMKVTYNESDFNTMIDVFVADRLELVSCALGNGIESVHKKNSSLRGILNHCVTKLGARLLRSTILQPPNQMKEIEERLDCVEELYKCPEALLAIRDTLQRLANFGRVLSLSMILKANAQYCDERHLNYILLLNSFFDEIEPMKELLSARNCKFFHDIAHTLSRDEFQELKTAFKLMIDEEARPAHGEQARIARCFAIKGNYNDVLDFLRKKFSNRKEEMHNHVAEVAMRLGYDLKMSHNQKKGFHMVLQLGPKQRNQFRKTSLPEDICQVDVMATMVTMKSIKLLTLSNLLDDTTREIIRISNLFLHDLLLHVQRHISVLYDMCEQVAKLDLLQSLAHATASGMGYVRPSFDNFTKVIDGRHPLLDFILEKPPVPNNIIATPDNRLHLVTGPNGSGKSIYIRQIVLLQIMAQIGCFVPATSATFRICDRILARIYFDDNLECGASAFTLEMKDIVYFFNVITDRTLIIIDELCRSTALKEGTALAMAICEHLMKTPAFIYFTTHFTYITKLQQLYPHIRCWQLETEEIRQNGRKPRLLYKHKVIPGVVTLEAYGLALTRSVWPDNVTNDCEQILEKIDDKSLETSIDKKMALKINLENTLVELKRIGKCNKRTVFQLWMQYEEDLGKLGLAIRFEDRICKQNVRNNDGTCTQVDNSDMVLTQTDRHTEILTLESRSLPQTTPKSTPNNNDFAKLLNVLSETSDFTEDSYLIQNRLTNNAQNAHIPLLHSRPVVLNETKQPTDTSSIVNYVPPRNKINILQNLVLKPGDVSNVVKKGNNSLTRNYSDNARKERQLLQDPDDYHFTPIGNVHQICDSQPNKNSAFCKFNTSNYGDVKMDGNAAFELFSQQINSLKSQEKIEDDLHNYSGGFKLFTPQLNEMQPNNLEYQVFDEFTNDEKENSWININTEFDVGNFELPKASQEQGEKEFNFMFDDENIEERQSQHCFEFDKMPGTSGTTHVFNNAEIPNQDDIRFDNDNSCFPRVVTEPSTVNNSISSVTSSNFRNGICYEKTSTPLPIPVETPVCANKELDSIDARIKYAQECLSNPQTIPPINYYTVDSNTEKKTSSDSMPTHLTKNVISCSSSTGTKPKTVTSDTDFAKPSEPPQKRRLLNSQLLNQTYYPDARQRTFEIEEIEEIPSIEDGGVGVVIGAEASNDFFPNLVTKVPQKSVLKQSTKTKQLNQLTKREVDAFYNQKREELIKSNDPEDIQRYYHELTHRPSMRQMRQSEVLLTARGTSDGRRVFDTPKRRKRNSSPFKKKPSFGMQFDQTMFSDANSRVFESFLEYEKNSNGDSRLSFEDFKRKFQFG